MSSGAGSNGAVAQGAVAHGLDGGAPKPPIRVVLVDDHRLFTEAIRHTLQAHGMSVVATAATAAEGIEAARREKPDLVLVDIALPDDSGISVGEKVLATLPEATVVAVTAFGEDAKLSRQAIQAGFHGYIPKDLPLARFLKSLSAALEGQVITPRYPNRSTPSARVAEEVEATKRSSRLTLREKDVLELLVAGYNSEDMARTLNVTTNTIRSHIQNIFTKLQVHSRLEAASFAIRFGIVKRRRGSSP